MYLNELKNAINQRPYFLIIFLIVCVHRFVPFVFVSHSLAVVVIVYPQSA